MLVSFIETNFWFTYEELTIERLLRWLIQFKQYLIALMYIKMGNNQVMIASYLSYRGTTIISECIVAWVPEWGELGRMLSLLLYINTEYLDAVKPQSYINLGMQKVAAIVDSKDFYTKTV